MIAIYFRGLKPENYDDMGIYGISKYIYLRGYWIGYLSSSCEILKMILVCLFHSPIGSSTLFFLNVFDRLSKFMVFVPFEMENTRW